MVAKIHWTDTMIDELRERHGDGEPLQDIGGALGMAEVTIRVKLRELGLNKRVVSDTVARELIEAQKTAPLEPVRVTPEDVRSYALNHRINITGLTPAQMLRAVNEWRAGHRINPFVFGRVMGWSPLPGAHVTFRPGARS